MIAVWLLLVGMMSLPFNLCARKVSAQIDSLIKGMTVNAWSAEAYNSSDFDESITNLAGIGADWALFTIFWFMETKYDNEMHQRLDLYSASDSSLIHAIQKAQELGMKVALKPMIDVVDGTWRAQISPSNWTLWFENYRDFINHYAVIAETNGVELFVVGCELSSSQSYESEWRQVISELKSQFSKETTYAADWNSYSTSDVAFWDAFDYVGVDAWFPLTNSYTPSVSQLISAWSYCTRSGYVGRDWVNELFSAYASTGKKVLFTEVGYCSKDGTNRHPYNYWYNSSVDFQEQADCYQAALEVFKDESWFEGWFWWNWETDPDAGLPSTPDEDHYTPQNKPAEDILYLYYSQPPPDIAITDVTPEGAVVDKGSFVDIDVTAQNQGNFTETFNVTAYANNTAIQTKALTLTGGDSTTTTFTWNTATTDLGDYRITAQAHPLPNETDLDDNLYTDGWISVILLGDVNGDGNVDIFDAIVVAGSFGSKPGDLNWNPDADLNGDNIIDIFDAIIVAANFGK